MGRRVKVWVALAAMAAVLPGAARAGDRGSGLLDDGEEAEQPGEGPFGYAVRKVAPGALPATVRAAASRAVPGFRQAEAVELRGRSPFSPFREQRLYRLKGRDAQGREVAVRVGADGSRPGVARPVPVSGVPAPALAEARRYAAGHGYALTRAQEVVWTDRVLGRDVNRRLIYLLGARPGKPGAERAVWVAVDGRAFRYRYLEDMWWRTKLTD